jgi:enoyl-CoA hydratase/carnithine racemase
VTEHSQLAMPETLIGLFPDVGGGYFLSRCPGRVGEFLALTGQVLAAGDAVALGLADVVVQSSCLPQVVSDLAKQTVRSVDIVRAMLKDFSLEPPLAMLVEHRDAIDLHFSKSTLLGIIRSLESDASKWAQQVVAKIRGCSPLMLAVALEQVRRARHLTLEEDLRMERTLIRHSFTSRDGLPLQPVEGIRALAIDKDRMPVWSPARIEDVTMEMVMPFFTSPWPTHAHPLSHFLV